jgi:hypothetical protein
MTDTGMNDPRTCPWCHAPLSRRLGPFPLAEDREAWLEYVSEHSPSCELIVGRRRSRRKKEE